MCFYLQHLSNTRLTHLSLSAGTNVTDQELDAMLESGQTDVFTQNVSAHKMKAKCQQCDAGHHNTVTAVTHVQSNKQQLVVVTLSVVYEVMTDVLRCRLSSRSDWTTAVVSKDRNPVQLVVLCVVLVAHSEESCGPLMSHFKCFYLDLVL